MFYACMENCFNTLASTATQNTTIFDLGDRVQHVRFGNGTVIQSTVGAAGQTVTVKFDNGEEKKLMASVAPMKRL